MKNYETIIDALNQEPLPHEKKRQLLHFFRHPLKDRISDDIQQTIGSLTNETVKRKFSYLITLNLNDNNIGKEDFWNRSPKEYIEHYRKTLHHAGKGTKLFERDDRAYNLSDKHNILTMEQLYTIGDLPKGKQPGNRNNCRDITRDNLKKTVELFCTEYTMDIPRYRTQESGSNSWVKRRKPGKYSKYNSNGG